MLKILITLIFSIIPISSCLTAVPTLSVSEKNLAESTRFLSENKKKPGVITLKSGLQYEIIKSGSHQDGQETLGQQGSKQKALGQQAQGQKLAGQQAMGQKTIGQQVVEQQIVGQSDFVSVHYRGTLLNNQEFDSSYKNNQPATFAVNAVIPGWTEALQLMKPGDKWKLYIPPHLAYGERGVGNLIQPNSALIFEVELLSVKSALDETQTGATEDWEGLD